MATLQPGEPARMYALSGVARAGATRAGYVSGAVFIQTPAFGQIGFGREGAKTRIGTLSIVDALDEVPNTCRFRVIGAVLNIGDEVILTLGSKNSYTRLFAGYALTVDQGYLADVPRHVYSDVAAVDYTWQLDFLKVTAQYRNQSATTIAKDLIARFAAANGFTTNGIAADLPFLDLITFTDEDLPDALTRLVRRIGGYWYVDYFRDVHLFLTETRNGDPVALTPAHKSLADVTHRLDRTQALTRVYVEGRGTTLLSHVDIGDTILPLETVEMFEAASDVFAKASFQGSEGGAVHLSFTGVVPTAGGSLVGVALNPPGAPGVAGTTGGSIPPGTHQWAYTFATATGETLPSPVAALNIGSVIAPPTVAPSLVPLTPEAGGALTPGAHQWAYTWTTAGGGETTPTPATAAASTGTTVPATGGIETYNDFLGGVLGPKNTWYSYKVTWIGNGGGETNPTNAAATVFCGSFGDQHKFELFIGNGTQSHSWAAIPAGVTQVKIYRSRGGASSAVIDQPHGYVATVNVQGVGSAFPSCSYMDDHTSDAQLGAAPPAANTAVRHAGTMRVYDLADGPPGTAKRLYRTAAGGSQLKLVTAVAAGVAVYDDGVADASLGANVPTSNTAGAEITAATVSSIATGPAGTTARKLYRTVAAGSQLKLVVSLGDNSTTAWLDTTSDAALGANAPVSDTSGLAVVGGQVGSGATTIPVANGIPFPATGGWAIIGNGEQVIRFTGKTSTALTGIPPTGIGAVTTAVVYNSTITVAPMLTGIPSSGTRSISGKALTRGDEIYLVVQSDDAARATQLAADVGGNGIREEWISDRRLSVAEARARGRATLQVRPLESATLQYRSRDTRTAAGKVVSVNLPAPTNLFGDFRIQSVTIDNFRPHMNQYPTYTVQASTTLFTFEDWLRRMRTTE